MNLPNFYVDDIIKRALAEDINYIDLATDYLLDDEEVSTANFVSKAEGVLCGIDCALRVFTLIDSDVKSEIKIKDGGKVSNSNRYGTHKIYFKRRKDGSEHFAAYVRNCL